MIFFWIISENETASPQNSCVEYWTKYNEGSIIREYKHRDAPTNSLECQKLCQNHSGCLHWSYRVPGAVGGYKHVGLCTLFSSLSSITTPNRRGYISGSKTCTHVSCIFNCQIIRIGGKWQNWASVPPVTDTIMPF